MSIVSCSVNTNSDHESRREVMAYEDSGEEYRLGKSLSDLRESGDLCDITILVSDGQVQAHKVILWK